MAFTPDNYGYLQYLPISFNYQINYIQSLNISFLTAVQTDEGRMVSIETTVTMLKVTDNFCFWRNCTKLLRRRFTFDFYYNDNIVVRVKCACVIV